MTQVFAAYEAMSAHERPTDNQVKMDEWVRRMSIATNRDLREFYRSWGMPLSTGLLENKTLDTYEIWMPQPL